MKKALVIIVLFLAVAAFAYFSYATNLSSQSANESTHLNSITGSIAAINNFGFAIALEGEQAGSVFTYESSEITKIAKEESGRLIDSKYSDIATDTRVELYEEDNGLTVKILE
ncbi:hypothetical protein KC644_02935 [Candidatus Berkelbacteria bacterium]|nr:hypothetical protein [Candidatus Berkelbacteria bacterium]